MVFLAFWNSAAIPVLAYCLIKLQWIFYSAEENAEWEDETHPYLIFLACWVFSLFFVGTFEKSLFGIMAELLTYNLRI